VVRWEKLTEFEFLTSIQQRVLPGLVPGSSLFSTTAIGEVESVRDGPRLSPGRQWRERGNYSSWCCGRLGEKAGPRLEAGEDSW